MCSRGAQSGVLPSLNNEVGLAHSNRAFLLFLLCLFTFHFLFLALCLFDLLEDEALPLLVKFSFAFVEISLDTEEHGTHLGQPVRVYDCYTVHVLLGGHHQLVVYHVLGNIAEAE